MRADATRRLSGADAPPAKCFRPPASPAHPHPGTPARTRQLAFVIDTLGIAAPQTDVVIPSHPLPYHRVRGT